MNPTPDTPQPRPNAPDLRQAARGWDENALAAELPRDQSRRWRGGQRVPAEEYLALVPALARNADVVLDLVRNELLLRRELGEAPRPDEYLRRFPQFQRELLPLFAPGPAPDGPPGDNVTVSRAAAEGPGDDPETLSHAAAAGPADGPPPGEPVAPAPSRIGRYRVLSEIDSGGFGVVYLGEDEVLGREVAIKVPHRHRMSAPTDVFTFLAEARTLAQLNHWGVVPVYDFGRTDDGRCYLVSKHVPGGSLAGRLLAGPAAPREAARLVASVAEALHHAHQRGLVHRDVKPANILLEADGRPVVADFGLALREEDYGQGPTHVGTPMYMSPEQARGEGHRVDARTDVYSLGVVFYELLTGRRPFGSGGRVELRELIKKGEPRPPRQIDDAIPRELDRICLKAMGKRASDRHSTALDLAEDLRQWLAGEGATPRAESPPRPPAPDAAAPAVAVPRGEPGAATSDQVREAIVPRGLRSFEAEDATFFLNLLQGPRGRGGVPESVRFWKGRLEELDADRTFRVGLIYGPSGCGKSSLVKAGVLPRLEGHVVTVYAEATADDTEARLLKGLRRQWPDLPPGLTLAGALAHLRRARDPGAGTKLVLVIDQFEQWLHALPAEPGDGLVEALRQCDGGRVQALILVRDDFWMGISRFMRELEVPLSEGRNSAPVDLFDPRHARKVLAAFGRAFGALPDGELAPDQERFLDQAVAGLAEGDKVIPVRLALFAEMVKGKPWTPATWRTVGGADGVGVAFLEETFSAPTAPPHHRAHQRAARAVLQRLLPEPGADLKGPMRSREELLEASGYAGRPREFDELLRILDGELRLVTATDREAAGPPPATPDAGARHYQLTHDYLVPALRRWLTHKQRETRRGRAGLRLAERAAAWAAKRESRHLPSWPEWARIRLFTRKRDWAPAQRAMMRQAARYHATRAAALVVLLALAGWGGWEHLAGVQARALRDRLLTASTADVPAIVGEMGAHRRRVDPLLREAAAGAEAADDPRRRLHLSLALLPSDAGQVDYLRGRLLDARAEDFAVIRDQLAPHKESLIGPLWEVLKSGDPDRRFRAACALAAYDPGNALWDQFGERVAGKLLAEPPLVLGHWTNALRPVGTRLLPPLAAFLADAKWGSEKFRTAVDLYQTYAGGRDENFALLEGRATGAADAYPAGVPRGDLAKQRAGAATALVAMGRAGKVWPLMAHAPDPTLRSYLIEWLGPGGADPKLLEARLAEEPDVTARRALILALGQFDPERLPAWGPLLLKLYADDPDPGVHAAAGWVLRDWERGEPLRRADAKLATGRAEGGRRWYVNGQGQTLAVVHLPGEGGAGDHFAIASREVTVRDFLKFEPDHKYDTKKAPAQDCPVNLVSWYQAAAYCNWLNKKEDIPEHQWCYLPNKAGKYEAGMTVAPDFSRRTGYRLPTGAEWVAACRAGARTGFSFGEGDEELLGRYAWWYGNSRTDRENTSRPVGSKKPNDLGLFDMHGNVGEWCHDQGGPPDDRDPVGAVTDAAPRVQRGGAYTNQFSVLRADPASRLYLPPNLGSTAVGFRPARTVR